MTTAKTYIVTFKSAFLPKFIDAHKMNKAFCVLNAPNKEAAEKTPPEDRLKPDWIHEVKTTK